MTTTYSTTETAKFIRETLKTQFPAIKFSVRSKSYSGGSSIDIRWADGATEAEVEPFVSKFAGATFDGMQDLKEYHDFVTEDGEHIRYGADFVFCQRERSAEFTQRVMEAVCAFWRIEPLAMNRFNWFDCPANGYNLFGNDSILDLISYALHHLNADMTVENAGYVRDWLRAMVDQPAEVEPVAVEEQPEAPAPIAEQPAGGVVISAEEIERIVNLTEPKDMTREIRKGDYVVLPRLSAAYQGAHVEYMVDRNSFTVTHGSMNTSSIWRFGATFGYTYTYADVSEIWRQRRVARTSVTHFGGKEITCKSSELEWYCVYADERYQSSVSWWAL